MCRADVTGATRDTSGSMNSPQKYNTALNAQEFTTTIIEDGIFV
jgi:hypothetical protein